MLVEHPGDFPHYDGRNEPEFEKVWKLEVVAGHWRWVVVECVMMLPYAVGLTKVADAGQGAFQQRKSRFVALSHWKHWGGSP